MYKMALLVNKVEGPESCIFLTEEIMAAKNLHFAPQFPQNEDFSVHDIAFLDANFLTKNMKTKKLEKGIAPHAPLPQHK